MIKALLKILKYVGFTLVGLIAVGAVLYMFGLRVVLDGGGSPQLRFVKSLDAQAKEIAQHRETQRATFPRRRRPNRCRRALAAAQRLLTNQFQLPRRRCRPPAWRAIRATHTGRIFAGLCATATIANVLS
jgi:hypothetical protein